MYVSYILEWEGLSIADQFLWPSTNNSLHDMKMFAIDFLSDFLRQKIHCYQAYQIESKHIILSAGAYIFIIIEFANSVAYVIQRELRL